MHDLEADREAHEHWVREAARVLEVDAALLDAVDLPTLHALARAVAHGVARPMSPVGLYLLGRLVAQGVTPADAVRRIEATVP